MFAYERTIVLLGFGVAFREDGLHRYWQHKRNIMGMMRLRFFPFVGTKILEIPDVLPTGGGSHRLGWLISCLDREETWNQVNDLADVFLVHGGQMAGMEDVLAYWRYAVAYIFQFAFYFGCPGIVPPSTPKESSTFNNPILQWSSTSQPSPLPLSTSSTPIFPPQTSPYHTPITDDPHRHTPKFLPCHTLSFPTQPPFSPPPNTHSPPSSPARSFPRRR